MKICLDAGHYGKYNPSPVVEGYYEAEMNWKLHLMLKHELEQYGIEVCTTRAQQERDLDVYRRGCAAKGCNLLLSIHSNGAANLAKTPDYPIVYAQISGVGDTLAERLAECIARVMGTNQGGRVGHREGKNGDYYGVLRGAATVDVTALLLEHSFHTNPAAAKWLMDDANLKRLAEAEAAEIAAHYGFRKHPPAVLYRVQVGAFAVRENAQRMLAAVRAAGFDGFIVEGEKGLGDAVTAQD